MAVWQENLKRLLNQKEVLILHGNVRDTAYIKRDGTLVPGLTDLIREIGRELKYQREIFWGVFFDHEGKGYSPMWSLERIEPMKEGSEEDSEREIKTTGSQERDVVVLTRWLKDEVKDVSQKTIFVINYIDKITPYSQRGAYPKDTALLITLIQKIIENIAENNRLIMIALQDTMLPLEYYTNSPRVAVMEIPLPDKNERKIYFFKHLSTLNLPRDQTDLLSNITDGLYARDLENILRDVIKEKPQLSELSQTILRKIVNRYRIGTEEDPWAGLPLSGEKGLLDSVRGWFQKRIIGQEHAIEEVVRAIKKARAGVTGLVSGQESKPRAVFFFAGPTGAGKTFLAKRLAEYLFDTQEAFLRFDMSEFKEEHTVSKLIGAPPGYVGYEKGGMLTNGVKSHPFSVLLFDEAEKAHPKIMDIFLQILDDGRLTDSRGQTVFFTESVIIFTSNIGTRTSTAGGQPIDEKQRLEKILAESVEPDEKDKDKKAKRIRKHFVRAVREFFMYEISRPELLNRIGSHIVAFNYIDRSNDQLAIINSKLEEISINFRDKFANIGYRLNFSKEVGDYFLKKHGQHIKEFGGRGLVNAMDDEVGHLLADQMLIAEKNKLTQINFVIFTDDKTDDKNDDRDDDKQKLRCKKCEIRS